MSAIRSILVHVDSSPRSRVRMRYAHALAERYDASVTVLFAVTPADLQFPYAAGAGFSMSASQQEFELDRRRSARALFDAARAEPLPRLQWDELRRDEALNVFARRALYCDLLVLGQREPTGEMVPDVPSDFVESVLVDSGKPALLLPYIGAPDRVAQTVLVAWKPTREAARALTAALPLLRGAAQVHLAMWSDDDRAAEATSALIQGHLRDHGIHAHVHRYGEAGRDVGNHLLSMASDLGADLLVMGSYGHSRAREWVLGGATRTVLQSMTVPVLMVH